MFTNWYSHVCFGLLFVASCSRLICAQPSFSVSASSYECDIAGGANYNMICLGDAHTNDDSYSDQASLPGTLSLIQEKGTSSDHRGGLAYYRYPVRMRDPKTRQPASFTTSFVFNAPNVNDTLGPGDGMAFVISEDHTQIGYHAGFFGFFGENGTNNFQSIVVEFDNYWNPEFPELDISASHVSLEFMNISYVDAKNASDVSVSLEDDSTVYAWVEYSAETKLLQVRVNNVQSKPINPLINYRVNLFDKVEEYMWIGFSGGTGDYISYYYVGDWTFNSSGIPLAATESRSKSRSKLGAIVGISLGVPVLLAVLGIFILLFVRKRDANSGIRLRTHRRDPALQLADMPEEYRFRYKHLSVATGGFSDASKLGQGGFGSVYRGVLPLSGVPVAVKKISRESNQGEREFMAEVSIISQLRHRNLIELLGWCDDRGNYLIVYELMPNGSLDKALFGLDEKHTGLSWEQRYNIVTGLAAAVDYLHHGWKQRVIHRDIKSSNVMLDENWDAKLGDFGLARLVDHQKTAATTLVAGTYGYLAPEAAVSGKFTEKTDVFAFGAVALEVACGRKASSFSVHKPQDEVVLVDWVWQRLSEGNLLSVVDSRLPDYDSEWMEVVLKIGLLCSHPDPLARPSMRHIVQVLAGDAPVPRVQQSKPIAVFTTSLPSSPNFSMSSNSSNPTTNSLVSSSSAPDSENTSEKPLLRTSSSSFNSLESINVVKIV